MDILVLSREFPPYVLGGISYHLKNLYNEVAKQGHNITVLAGNCPQSYHDLESEISDQISVYTVEFGYRKGYYLLYPLALRKRFLSFDTTQFDLAVSHTPLPYTIPDLPTVTKYHDCIVETRTYLRNRLSTTEKIGDSLLHPIREFINKKSLQKTDYAIFNSHINKKGWLTNYKYNGPYSVIHNGVDTEVFSPVDISREDYVLFVGTTEQKGLKSVIKYADKEQRPVHIVGDIQLDHTNIFCHGRVPQEKLPTIYSQAAATIHPAKFESFGNVILESLACETPVVTTPDCGASEVLTDKTGVVTYDLASGIEEAVSLESTACRSVAEDHPWRDVANKSIRLFDEVIKTRS